MEKLNTIQKRNKLNDIYAIDEKTFGNAHHRYKVIKSGTEKILAVIQFQKGGRNEGESIEGVSTADLLEICRNQLKSFQTSEFATRENALALTAIEEALLWLNFRAEDRAERNVLGTHEK